MQGMCLAELHLEVLQVQIYPDKTLKTAGVLHVLNGSEEGLCECALGGEGGHTTLPCTGC